MHTIRVSWDDGETLALKTKFANDRCLGGKMIWALDLDEKGSPTLQALVSAQESKNGGGGVGGLPGGIFGELSPNVALRVDEDIKTQNDVPSVGEKKSISIWYLPPTNLCYRNQRP